MDSVFIIFIIFVALLWLYAFSDDITFRLASKRAKRKALKKAKENEKGSDVE